MIRDIIIVIILLIGSVFLGSFLAQDSGVVAIIWKNTTIETSIVVAFIFLLLAFILVWQVARLITRIDWWIWRWKNKSLEKNEQYVDRKTLARQKACASLMNAMHSAVHLPQLEDIWYKLSRKLRKDPDVIACYAECLMHYADQSGKIYKLLTKALRQQIHPSLLKQFVKLKSIKAEKRLVLVEKCLRQRPNDPALLLAAGELCLQSQLWGKARTYFNQSLSLQPTPAVYAGLGQLAEEAGDVDIAMQRYKEGLELK